MGVVKFFNFFSNTPQKCVSCVGVYSVPQVYHKCGTCGTYLLCTTFCGTYISNQWECLQFVTWVVLTNDRARNCMETDFNENSFKWKICHPSLWFHIYFWFMSLIVDTRGWFWRRRDDSLFFWLIYSFYLKNCPILVSV